MYLAYALAHDRWENTALIGVSGFIGFFMPLYAKYSNKIEVWAMFHTASVSAGRLIRFAAQYAFNLLAFGVILHGGGFDRPGMASVGGFVIAALVTTLASQGAQYLGLSLSNRGVGDPNRNVLVGLSANIIITSLATAGVPMFKEIFLLLGTGVGGLVFLVGLLSDLRGLFYPRGGIGVYFGTFNPFHVSHLKLVRTALEERRLERIIIHPTVVPKFYQRALARREVEVAGIERGMQVMKTTDNSDANVDYFPAGNRFYAPETRRTFIQLAIEEAGLSDKVTVAYYPEVYDRDGFYGVIGEIRRRNPGKAIHGLHGSDYGGMTVRGILDECGWIYPAPFLRRDNISATAIRDGANGMTSQIVAQITGQMTDAVSQVETEYGTYRNENGVLRHA
ncbi:MAG: hypothetical protein O2967_18075 [Proteobacteria bacterium]|nr:hypothetical protein [Pseudomonadota bacterium]